VKAPATFSADLADEHDPRVVVVTRPLAEGVKTGAILREMGFVPVLAPMLQILPRDDLAISLSEKARLGAVALTSGNAISAMAEAFLPFHPNVKIFAVGDATAERAREAGFGDVMSAHGDAKDLAELVAARMEPRQGTILLPAGQGEGAVLAARLRAARFKVRRVVAYRVRPPGEFAAAAYAAIESGQVYAVLFYSAVSAQNFVRLLPSGLQQKLGTIAALAIGNQAADALKPLHWGDIRVAHHPAQEELLALL